MSRHQASRRRTYGRRQHDLHERRSETRAAEELDLGGRWNDDAAAGGAFRDLLEPRLRWAEGRG